VTVGKEDVLELDFNDLMFGESNEKSIEDKFALVVAKLVEKAADSDLERPLKDNPALALVVLAKAVKDQDKAVKDQDKAVKDQKNWRQQWEKIDEKKYQWRPKGDSRVEVKSRGPACFLSTEDDVKKLGESGVSSSGSSAKFFERRGNNLHGKQEEACMPPGCRRHT